MLITAACLLVILLFLWRKLAHSESITGDLSKVRAPLVIFDFDGTLCPSYSLLIDQINQVADEYNIKHVGQADAERFRSMNSKAIMKSLGISNLKLPFLLRKLRRNAQLHLLELRPVAGIPELLKDLKTKGYSLGILTSNSQKNVQLYLEKYDLNFFDFIYTGNNVFSKARHLKKVLKKTGLKEAIYVGDEVRDMEAAKEAGIIGIAVCWGCNSQELLAPYEPCLTPNELKNLLINILNT